MSEQTTSTTTPTSTGSASVAPPTPDSQPLPGGAGAASFDAEVDSIFSSGGDADSVPDEFGDQPEEGAEPEAASPSPAATEPELEPEPEPEPEPSGTQAEGDEPDPLASEDEEPRIEGKTYRYSENYAKTVLLPARDLVRALKAEVDPDITVDGVKSAYQAKINLQSIVDDLVSGGSDGVGKIVREFYETATQANNPAAMADMTMHSLSIMRERHPEWYSKAIVAPLQQEVYYNLQRDAARMVADVRKSELTRLVSSGMTPQQAQAELDSGKSKEYRDAQWYLWATQKAAADKLGSYLEEDELLKQVGAQHPDPLEIKRAEIERRERALNERAEAEYRAQVKQWQTAIARDEYAFIQQTFDQLVGGKMAGPPAIKNAVRQSVTQEVDRQLRSNKLFMEQYMRAIRIAQRSGSSEDRQKALKLWQTRADALIRAKAREILAEANNGVQQSNAEAHARAAEAQKRTEPTGTGQPPKRSIAPPVSQATSAETWEQELDAIFR